MIGMVIFLVIIMVVALLSLTGNHRKCMRRNSMDSLQLADGNIVNSASKRKTLMYAR